MSYGADQSTVNLELFVLQNFRAKFFRVKKIFVVVRVATEFFYGILVYMLIAQSSKGYAAFVDPSKVFGKWRTHPVALVHLPVPLRQLFINL